MYQVPIIASRLLLALLIATPMQAQSVRGQVIDSLTGAAIGKGFVVLLDDQGSEVQRSLTTSSGQFEFDYIAPGRYRLRSERIGYRARETDLFEVQPAASVEYRLLVTSIPIQLAGIDVRAEKRCGSLEQAPEFGELWEEARKALRAASWSADHKQYFYRRHAYRRVLDTRRRRVLREAVKVEYGPQWVPYASWAADSLLEHGYVVERSGGVDYFGPDANVLLDVTFQATHCFRVVRGVKEHEGLLGLSFEPTSDRDQADITGTLWVDEQTSELRAIEYKYTKLRYNAPPAMGGASSFALMPSGAWVIVRWEIRAPVTPDLESLTGHQNKNVIGGFLDVGEEVIEITDMSDNLIYRPSDVTILMGSVQDSVRGQALRDELVTVVGTGYQATTGSDGAFEIPTLLEGEYVVTTARMDSLGYRSGNIEVQLIPGDTVAISLVIPSIATIHKTLCGREDGGNVLVGTVRIPVEGEPFGGQVTATWTTVDSTSGNLEAQRHRTRPDLFGRYVLCGLPADEFITVELQHDDFEVDPASIQFAGGSVMIGPPESSKQFDAPERVWRRDFYPRVRP